MSVDARYDEGESGGDDISEIGVREGKSGLLTLIERIPDGL